MWLGRIHKLEPSPFILQKKLFSSAILNITLVLLDLDLLYGHERRKVLTFREVLGIVADDLSSIYKIGEDQRFRSFALIFCLIKRAVQDKGFRAIITYRCKNYAYLTKKNRLLT